jgi:uncharacterized protein (DUF1800 family)
MSAALHPMLRLYEPTASDPFDAIKAAHLLNRAAFGGTPAEIAHLLTLGPRLAVDHLLDFPDKSAEEQDPRDVPNLSAIADYPANFRELSRMFVGKTKAEQVALFQKIQFANRAALTATGDWWMRRMAAAGRHPLQEKLTLFWHGHFTTSADGERAAKLIWDQNETLRRHAAGNFAAFVKAISRDPAMLDYLNGNQNQRFHPNENYARELMELFTLGVGHYTEDDVKAAARAFTGWGHNGIEFLFRKFDHDYDAKTFLGHRGNFDGDDVIDILLQQPACATHVASRVWNFFVSEEPDPAVIASLGNILRDSHYDLRPMLRTLFTSRAFYEPMHIGSQIKSPVQLLIGTARLLGVDLPPGRVMFQPNSPLMQMGQLPFFPPNVRGWPGGRAWINTSTIFVRYNAALRLAAECHPDPTPSRDTAVDHWLARLIPRPIAPEQRQPLLDALNDNPDASSIRRMIQLIVSMPEYELC